MRKKIFTFGVILFSGLSFLSLKAETGIPYLPQATNFGGAVVTDLTDFFPANGDYTIEADATAGTEIVISGGIYRYTPESTGKVRFAQRNGVIYVYEGTVFKTTLQASTIATFPDIYGGIDDAAAKTGIYSATNLIKNPGFETLGDLLSEGNYKGVNWESNGYDYGSKSRIRVNTADFTGYEGSGSFMLHGYGSPAEYLAQNIGSLKAKTYYKAVFTTWSHSNTGNGNYIIAVGNAISDASIASSTFNTGATGYVEMKQEFTFYTGENAIPEAYLTITRTNTAISHFDRMTLVEGITLGTATTGVTNLTYLAGNAYAPEFALQEGEFFDMATYVVNPNFDSNVSGWTTTTGAQNSTIKSGTSSDHPGGVMAGSNFWENWRGTAFTGKMYQVIEGLPNGKYELTLSVFSNKQAEDGHDWMFVYANEWETPVKASPDTLMTIPTAFTVTGYVNTGKLEIGLNMKEAIANWVGIDNAILKYYGYDLNAANKYLQDQIQLVQDELVGKVMNNAVSANLAAAIVTANAALSSSDEPTIESATVGLGVAADSAKVSVASYATLKEAIDNAEAGKGEYASLAGYNAYVAVINAVNADYNQKDLTNQGVVEAVSKLEKALKACKFTQLPPFDCTFAIGNPSFEGETIKKEDKVFIPNYWNVDYDFGTGGKDIVLHDTVSHDGKYNLNIWSNQVNYIDLYQDILLPAGQYKLTAYMRTEAILNETTQMVETKVTDQHIYAENLEYGFRFDSNFLEFDEFDVLPAEWETEPLSWREMLVEFELEEEQLVRIGATSTGDGTSSKGWFQVDNFRLEQTWRDLSSIQNIQVNGSDLTIRQADGGIVVSTDKDLTLPIYSVTGQLVKMEKVTAGETFIPVASGVYIVNKAKVVVK